MFFIQVNLFSMGFLMCTTIT